MSKITFDVDIDFGNRDDALALFDVRLASIIKDGTFEKHNTGVYFQPIPSNPATNYSNIDYKVAEDLGYFKVDFLNLHIYEGLTNSDISRLVEIEPMWELLREKEFVKKLIHIKDYYELVSSFRPQSVEDLAIILALIRPSKKYLQGKSRDKILSEIWDKPTEGYWFKKSHSLAYALAIVVQMNYLVEQLSNLD
jgi:hypothetical protein